VRVLSPRGEEPKNENRAKNDQDNPIDILIHAGNDPPDSLKQKSNRLNDIRQ